MVNKTEIVVATNNKGKLAEIKAILSDFPIIILGLSEIGFDREIEENGQTFLENSLIKARTIASLCKRYVLADDSGLEVACLGGKPGVFSARFAGENATDKENNVKLLKEMEGISRQKRKAAFRCVMSLASPSGRWVASVGSCPGEITFEPKGNFGFGYDPIFFVPQLNKTMAEIPLEVKNKISHRARALARMKTLIEDFISYPEES
ncbi:MAG TPA: XTP/dITP diphosphatase [Deltaproteobacteria bacterium]|nr:XTP/dITP diphosphatase [Deltaproteobacteria bacterium]